MTPMRRNGIYQLYVPKRTGRSVERSTGTKDATVYRNMKRMLAALKDARRWTLLDAAARLTPGTRTPKLSLGRLYDAYAANALDALELSLSASALAPHVAAFLLNRTAAGLEPRNVENIKRQLDSFTEYLTEQGAPGTTADLTAANATAWLSTLTTSPGTRRQYLYAVTGFARYLLSIEVLRDYPFSRVTAPSKNASRMRYVSEADDVRIVESASPKYRALLALVKATGADLTVALGLRRRQINLAEHTADIRRFKTDGTALPVTLIEPWAIPFLAPLCAERMPSGLLWPGLTRSGAYQHHVRCCTAVGVDDYTIKDSRHSVAVRMIEQGYDVFEVADQLNNSADLVARVYARHVTKAKERAAKARAMQPLGQHDQK